MTSVPSSARAVVVPQHGGSDVLTVEERPVGRPEARQLLVEAGASGVNFVDVYEREGVYRREPPFVLGREGAGVVREVGSDVSGFHVGDRVAWAAADGSHADYVLVDSAVAVPVPDGVSVDQ